MDIKKMAELVRSKVQEVEEAGIFDELAQVPEKQKASDTNDAENSENKGEQERNRS
ncbi:MAG: hypothetical protein ABJF50_08820 [Paracoccaceae bacterium]